MRYLLTLLALLFATSAQAERIEIDTGDDPESRLEIRNVVLPGGEEVELYVVQGERVSVRIDDEELIAQHIEVDLSNRLVRIVGFGTYVTPEQTVQGFDLTIELEQENLTGRDVLIVTEALDVYGAQAVRIPGQIDVLEGRFSPCSRCGQEVQDYGFSARRIELYPGDRLVAFDVTMLIRERPLLSLPLLVVPLARPDRQPRLAIEQGNAGERAEVALDWPYVAGPNAFGTFSVRYYADVVPGGGGLQPLGGRVATSYLGGGIDHRFYTPRGTGDLELFYRPGFRDLDAGEWLRPQFTVRFNYETLDGEPGEDIEEPAIEFGVIRDDRLRDRLIEYRLELRDSRGGVQGTFSSQGFGDADLSDEVESPSYDDRLTPRRTPIRLVLEPEEERFTVGPLLLSRLALDLGAFEDSSNPTNRSAAMQEFSSAGRILERHSLQLTPIDLWTGLQLGGHTNFVGYYYSTGERQIDWDTQLSATQRFGTIGSFGVVFTRDISEGETPFRFDQLPLRNRTDLRASLRLQPLSWLGFQSTASYVFVDSRRPELEGFQPVESQLRLFDDVNWVSVEVENSYDIEEGDPGNLAIGLVVRNPNPTPRAQFELNHVEDLAVRPGRLTGVPSDESETSFAVEFGLPVLRLDLSGGYRYHPPPPADPSDPPEHWLPLEAGVTVGTLEQGDELPGLRVAYERDLNLGRVDALSYQAALRLGPVEIRAEQRFDLPEGGTASSTISALYPGVAEFEATGLELIDPVWLGLPQGDPTITRYSATLQDAPLEGPERWQVRYLTRFDPNLPIPAGAGSGGFRDSALEARVLLEEERLGRLRFSVDFFADLQLKDDSLQRTYLRRAGLELAADFAGVVGVQGALGYRGIYDEAGNEVSRAELRFDELALTVHPVEELYLGALFEDVWDLTGNDPSQPVFDIRPELFVVWDRCCWALMGGWDTESGELRLAVTAPGSETGITQVFDTPLMLPGRGEGASP